MEDIVHKYVRFIFSEWEKDPYSPIATKNPPTVWQFRLTLELEQAELEAETRTWRDSGSLS